SVAEKEDLRLPCKSGVPIRRKVADISEQGRATQGVKLIRLDEGDEIAAITRLDDQKVAENGNGNGHLNGHSEIKDENAGENARLHSDDEAADEKNPDGEAT